MSKRHRIQRLGRIGARELGTFKQQSGESVLLIEHRGKIYVEGIKGEPSADDIKSILLGAYIMRRGP